MNCYSCHGILKKNRLFMISNKHFCGEKCFKLGFDLLVEESNLSKLSIKK